MLTGARRDEIGALKWSEIDFDKAVISLPSERTKGGRQHTIALAPSAIELLKGIENNGREYVFGRTATRPFSGWSKSKIELDSRLGGAVVDWVPHDFRRAMSTTLNERLSVQPHIVEEMLGHAGTHKAGVAGTYNLSAYAGEKRAAWLRWANHLESLITEKPVADIITMRR
jgi:integrase